MSSAVLYKDLTIEVPYGDRESLAAKVLTFQTLIAIIVDIILIMAICKQQLQGMAIDTMFILSNIIADLFFASLVFIYCIFLWLGNGWWMGQLGCLISASVLISSVALSILSVVGLTAYRYSSIIFSKQLNQKHAILAIASIWLAISILVTTFIMIPGFLENSVALQPSLLYCALSWWKTDTNISITAISLCLIVIFFSITFIAFAYIHICLMYRHMQRSKVIDNLPTTLKNNSELVIFVQISNKEWILIKKALLISVSLLLVWLPYCVKIVIEVATGEPSSYSYDVYTAWIACLNTIFNAWILFMYDGKTRSAVLELFLPFSWSQTSSSSEVSSLTENSNAPSTLNPNSFVSQGDQISIVPELISDIPSSAVQS